MLVGVEYWEDQLQDLLEKVVEEVLVAFLDVDYSLVVRRDWTMRKLEKVEINSLLCERLGVTLEIVLLHPAVCGKGRHAI